LQDDFLPEVFSVRRSAARHQNLFDRLGIMLVILGMLQSLAPTYFWPSRSSLSLLGRLRVVLAASFGAADRAAPAPWAGAPAPSESEQQDQEPGGESHDTEDLAEALAWSEAVSERHVPGRSRATSGRLVPVGDEHAPRKHAGPNRRSSQALDSRASHSASLSTHLCRFTC
jgi:hypothetical protein